MHALRSTHRLIAIGLLTWLLLVTESSILWGHLAVAAESSATTLRRANELFSQSEFTRAVQEYEAFIAISARESAAAAEVPQAYYFLGLSLGKLGASDRALEAFRRVVELEQSESIRSQSGFALIGIANCLFDKGDYQGALAAVQDSEKYPVAETCGNAVMEHMHQYLVQVGTLQEYLGHYDKVVPLYLEAASYGDERIHVRLLDLFEASGQLTALLTILEGEDLAYEEILKKYPVPNDTRSRRSSISRTIHRIFELRDLEKARAWSALVDVIHPGRQEDGNPRRHFEIEEASRILAKHPTESMPLLLEGLLNLPEWADFPANKCYTLGLIGTPEAVDTLKRKALKEGNVHILFSLVHDLSIAGERGVTAMNELYSSAEGNLKLAIERYRNGKLFPESSLGHREFPFPAIPPDLKLPIGCHGLYPHNGYTCEVASR